ncbi:MAG: hypothetical protein HYU66_06890 [Armatimonadetes bacterium]|nr:hypothetical protein [Armatimonadota bacterium]
MLHWKGPHGGSVLQLRGPSHARLTDLSVLAPTGSGIVVDACDQANGRIYLSQANLTGIGTNDKAAGGLRVEGLEQTGVLAQALQGGSLMEHWVEVAGGQRRKPSPVAVYCGATGTSERPYTVTRGGRLLVRSVYHEIESQVPQALALDDSGELSIDATRFSYQTAPDRPLIAVKGFEGSFALLSSLLMPVNSPHTARVSLSGSGAGARVLLLGDLFWVNELGADADRIWHDETSPAAHAGMLLCNMNSNLKGATPNGFGRFDPRGDQSEANLLDAVKPIRDAWLWLPGESRPGVTNLVLHRVSCRVGAGGVGLRLSPKPAP